MTAKTMALYQKWPAKHRYIHGALDIKQAALTISLFPATIQGLDKATKAAKLASAKLIRIPKDFHYPTELQTYIEDQINKGLYIDLYKSRQAIQTESKKGN